MIDRITWRGLGVAFALLVAGCAVTPSLPPEEIARTMVAESGTGAPVSPTKTPRAEVSATPSAARGTFLQQPTPATKTPTSTPAVRGLLFAELSMANEKQGWATLWDYPEMSNVIHTEDGGWSWMVVTPPQSFTDEERQFELMAPSAFFLDSARAWVIYDGRDKPVWRTADGGKTWIPSSNLFASDRALLFFRGPSIGWMLLYEGATSGGQVAMELYGTRDGGSSWVNLVPYYAELGCPSTGMYYADEQVGWISGACPEILAAESLLHTQDGGDTWDSVDLPAPSQEPHLFENADSRPGCLGYALYSPVLFNRDNGALVLGCEHWIRGDSENPVPPKYLYRTLDGGRSWTTSAVPDKYVTYVDQRSMWTVSATDSGLTIWHSSDAGISWRAVSNTAWTGSVFIFNDRLAYAFARPLGASPPPEDRKLLRSTDGCRTWEIVTPRLTPSMDL